MLNGAPMDAESAAVKTGKDFMTLPASKQEAFEAKYPEKARQLEAEFHRGRTISNARGTGQTSHTVAQVGPPDSAPSFRSEDFEPSSVSAAKWRDTTNRDLERGRATLAALPPGHPMRAQFDALNMGIGTGRAVPARAAAPVPAPKGAAPVGAKTRVLGGFRK